VSADVVSYKMISRGQFLPSPFNVRRIEVLKFQLDKGVYRYLVAEISCKPASGAFAGFHDISSKKPRRNASRRLLEFWDFENRTAFQQN
jgi:hypothetical protein